MNPEKEAKRKEAEQALMLAMADVWLGGQMKYCWAAIRFDDPDYPSPAERRATLAASGSER